MSKEEKTVKRIDDTSEITDSVLVEYATIFSELNSYESSRLAAVIHMAKLSRTTLMLLNALKDEMDSDILEDIQDTLGSTMTHVSAVIAEISGLHRLEVSNLMKIMMTCSIDEEIAQKFDRELDRVSNNKDIN